MRVKTTLPTALALLLLAAPLAAGVREAGKVYRVGVLSAGTRAGSPWDVFEDTLRERGWTEARNIVLEYRFAEGRLERLPELATDLVRLNVDVIVSSLGTTGVAHKATSRIPIVMLFGVTDVEAGLVKGLERPGGNITGLTGDVTVEIVAKRLELLREVAPRTRRVAVLFQPFPGAEVYRKELEAGARKLGLALHYVEIHSPDALGRAFEAIRKSRADALFCGGDAVTMPLRAQIADFAARERLPGVYGPREWAEVGGLVAYGVNRPDLFRRVAVYADRILRGAKPAELPVERPTKYDLVVNLRTARALGLTIPPSVLVRADQVIE